MATREAIHDNKLKSTPSTLPPSYSESSETCPSYSCSVAHSSTLLMKRELSTPTTISARRNWKAVHAEVCGTLLRVRALQGIGSQSHHLQRLPARQGSPPSHSDPPSQVYTLQGGEAGIAADYAKRKFVFRVRAGAEQFLLAADTLSNMLKWIEALNAAINTSLPLDMRRMPNHRTLPRPSIRDTPRQDGSMKRKFLKLWAKCIRTAPNPPQDRPGNGRNFRRVESSPVFPERSNTQSPVCTVHSRAKQRT